MRLYRGSLEWLVALVGLAAAVVAGVAAYQLVGQYGDGPFGAGFFRMDDSDSGHSVFVHQGQATTGRVWRILDGRSLTQVGLDTNADGREDVRAHFAGVGMTRIDTDADGDGLIDTWAYFDRDARLVKTAFSLAHDGVVDAWAYHDRENRLVEIHVSTRRDGTVDRWEYYEQDQIVRVDEDTDRDGRADRSWKYQDGIRNDLPVPAGPRNPRP